MISMFRRCNTETGILSNFVKILGAVLVQNKDKETRKVSLAKETAQIFWMQDSMKLKSMHPSNSVCKYNLPSLECFKGSANSPS